MVVDLDSRVGEKFVCEECKQTYSLICCAGFKDEAGGVSGKPVQVKSDQVLKWVAERTENKIPLIGVGGVFTAADAYRKIKLGASLVEVYTGWIYEGPLMVKRINQGLVELLKKDGFKHISEAIGSDLKR